MVTILSTNGGNGASALPLRSLINHKTLSKTRRALLGASILKGEHDLKPTAKLIAQAVGCSVGYVRAAAKLSPAERQRVQAGFRPLIEPKVKGPPVPSSPVEISEEELVAIVHRVGVGRVWDTISKLLV
jgi:hypothetical protein